MTVQPRWVHDNNERTRMILTSRCRHVLELPYLSATPSKLSVHRDNLMILCVSEGRVGDAFHRYRYLWHF